MNPWTGALLRGEASYLLAPRRVDGKRVETMVGALCAAISDLFGAVFVVELWTPERPIRADDSTDGPRFRLVCDSAFEQCSTMHRLVTALRRVRISNQRAEVSVDVLPLVAPPLRDPVVPPESASRENVHLVGIELHPVHQDPETGDELPMTQRLLQGQLARALREAAFEFSRRETEFRPRHYQALGRRALKKIVWDADARLAAISRKFDLLLMVTPVNTEPAFEKFRASGFGKAPEFFYRRRTIDPPLLKRDLYRIPIEKIDDPTLAFLFEEKRRELGLKLTLVEERETERFLPTGIALFGNVGGELLEEATRILKTATPKRAEAAAPLVDAKTFAARAEEFLLLLREKGVPITSRVEMRDELTSLTVSDGNLLVGSGMSFPAGRVEALLQHEVGTHVVTHWNGRAQPFELLEVGLAGYDALQEGLAVFAEYLVGGLTQARLRTLAVRVVAAHMRIQGAGFVDTFRELRDRYEFSDHTAFLNTIRVFRAGGLVKDAVYFRGLQAVLDYVGQGGALELLLVGKVATEHVSIVRELQRRDILKPLLLRPPYLDSPASHERLERARKGLRVRDILESEAVSSDEA